MANNKSYRIRTSVGGNDSYISFNANQTVGTFDILSLKISQENAYRLMSSNTGIIVGRVLANGGFGVPNAKISIFVEYDGSNDQQKRLLYSFNTPRDYDNDGIVYNLLPKESDNECHQDVGTFPTKQILLDNDSWIEVFDTYYKYTTTTNNAGDYMIYGVPVGTQQIHCDVDLSDCGVLSQTPRDMSYKGYDMNLFESPTKFRKDTNLSSLAQIISQNSTIWVYPFWGDTSDDGETNTNAAITRHDINISYKFESFCVFMGSVISDTNESSFSKKCVPHKKLGKMSELVSGEGNIEMIRKTESNQIEQFSIEGDKLIDDDGVWCYQIPMNLDYVVTDEYGNMVLSEDPNKGIATRARVRFRISMNETIEDAVANKRARYLVPNNPQLNTDEYPDYSKTHKIDYEFGSNTKEESFRDIFWNNVYTVKSYIPRLQKKENARALKFSGIKSVNQFGSNNPMPFNNLLIRMNFQYMFICALVKLFVSVVYALNIVITGISSSFYILANLCVVIANSSFINSKVGIIFAGLNGRTPDKYGTNFDDSIVGTDVAAKNAIEEMFCRLCRYHKGNWTIIKNMKRARISGIAGVLLCIVYGIGRGITLSGLCEDENGNSKDYTPGMIDIVRDLFNACPYCPSANDDVSELYNCVENALAQENNVTNFNFQNDWINGTLYFPLWYRKIKPKRTFFGITLLKGKDQWCQSDAGVIVPNKKSVKSLKVYQTCAQTRVIQGTGNNDSLKPLETDGVTSVGYDEFGITVTNTKYNGDRDCYSGDCTKKCKSYVPLKRGIIVQKETMLGDYVYYYKPNEFDGSYTKDTVTLFATDLVLLGSLNNCDMYGLPQFFKALESTTYNMPPDLLSEDYEYLDIPYNEKTSDESNFIDKETIITEFTGADWGNVGKDQSSRNFFGTNQFDNGGLFYGLGCFNSFTKPKTCINLSRICEFGVSLDETQEILSTQLLDKNTDTDDTIEDKYETLTPDGYISYDDISQMDYRSMFATLNNNHLKTKLNNNTGLREYDLNYLYINNFDGSLYNLMKDINAQETTEKDRTLKAKYANNYKLEKSCNDYLSFRYGSNVKRNGNRIYFYDYNKEIAQYDKAVINAKNRFPRYDNSFYFYFGRLSGKTAIDKFRTKYFAECSTDVAGTSACSILNVANEWCSDYNTSSEGKGYIAFDTNMDLPINVTIVDTTNKSNVYYINNVETKQFYVGENIDGVCDDFELVEMVDSYDINVPYLKNGKYDVYIIDGSENDYKYTVNHKGNPISYELKTNAFNVTNNTLYDNFVSGCKFDDGNVDWKTLYDTIANSHTLSVGRVNRGISGVILVGKDVSCNSFSIEITPKDSSYFGTTTLYTASDGKRYSLIKNNDGTYTCNLTDGTMLTIYKDDSGRYYYKEQGGQEITVNVVVYSNYDGCRIVIDDNQVSSVSGVGYLGCGPINTDNGNYYIFGVPYGEQTYNVTIVQRCDNNDTNNVSTKNVTVGELVFKMYINGIDYDIIKSFNTGWVSNDGSVYYRMNVINTELSSQTYNPLNNSKIRFNQSSVYGWNDMLNIGKYLSGSTIVQLYDLSDNDIQSCSDDDLILIGDVLSMSFTGNGRRFIDRLTDISTPYSWTEAYCLNSKEWDDMKNVVVEYNKTLQHTQDEIDEYNNTKITIIETISSLIDYRREFAHNVVAAFRCGNIDSRLKITYKSNALPIKYSIVGDMEYEEDMRDNYSGTTYTAKYTYTYNGTQYTDDIHGIKAQTTTQTNNNTFVSTTIYYRDNDTSQIVYSETYIEMDGTITESSSYTNGYSNLREDEGGDEYVLDGETSIYVQQYLSLLDKKFGDNSVLFKYPTLTSGVLPFMDENDNVKLPYFVQICDANNSMIPQQVSSDAIVRTVELSTNPQIGKQFGVHFLNNALNGDVISVNGFVEKPIGLYRNGMWNVYDITMNGYVSGTMYNGINGLVKATINGEDIPLYNSNQNENIINSVDHLNESGEMVTYPHTYGNYSVIYSDEYHRYKYFEPNNGNYELSYSDGYGETYTTDVICGSDIDFSESLVVIPFTLYHKIANMWVVSPISTSVSYINISSGGLDGNNIRYYMYKANAETYPFYLNTFHYNATSTPTGYFDLVPSLYKKETILTSYKNDGSVQSPSGQDVLLSISSNIGSVPVTSGMMNAKNVFVVADDGNNRIISTVLNIPILNAYFGYDDTNSYIYLTEENGDINDAYYIAHKDFTASLCEMTINSDNEINTTSLYRFTINNNSVTINTYTYDYYDAGVHKVGDFKGFKITIPKSRYDITTVITNDKLNVKIGLIIRDCLGVQFTVYCNRIINCVQQ